MTEMSRKNEFEIHFFESILKRNPRYVDVIELLGELYTRNGRISDGLRMDRKLVRLKPDSPNAYYNLACSLALKKRKAEAIDTLQKAISLGYSDYDWLMQDPDLDGLKSYHGFKKLLSGINPSN